MPKVQFKSLALILTFFIFPSKDTWCLLQFTARTSVSKLNYTFNLDGSFFHLPAPTVLYCMHSCDCSSTWCSPTLVLVVGLQKKEKKKENLTKQQCPQLSRRRFWWDHACLPPAYCGNRVGTALHSKSQTLKRTEAVVPSHLICRDSLVKALPGFHRSSFLHCFRKPWQKRAEKVALLNPVYLTVSITTWHSYLYSRRISFAFHHF